MHDCPHDFVVDRKLYQSWSVNLALSKLHLQDEATVVKSLMNRVAGYHQHAGNIYQSARELVMSIRERSSQSSALDAFMHEYDLSSEEGVLLMCIAEALLRIPDEQTAEKLLEDKLAQADWHGHLGHSSNLFVNASTWGLLLTGQVINLDQQTQKDYAQGLKHLIKRSGEPMIKMAMRQAMKIMAYQFVMGRDMSSALKRSQQLATHSTLCSFDMLGEAAMTEKDAESYLSRYLQSVQALAEQPSMGTALHQRHGISVKLSALHPRYGSNQTEMLLRELLPRFKQIALAARDAGIGLTMDAEECDRLEISLMLFIRLLQDSDLRGWDGLGLAVQAFQKRAIAVLDWLLDIAKQTEHKIPVRLVKGAYWDSEIKLAQQQGLEGYPVFTRKVNTDVSYLACTQFLLDHRDRFYPQFATHNAHSVAAVLILAGTKRGHEHPGFEFQRLHGMGDALYQQFQQHHGDHINCRVYAPVGSHEDLLPYLVRRLLENGANTSFVNRVFDEQLPLESVLRDPMAEVRELGETANPDIPLPLDLFGEHRVNSTGYNLSDFSAQKRLADKLDRAFPHATEIGIVSTVNEERATVFPIITPQNKRHTLGYWSEPTAHCVNNIISAAKQAQPSWDLIPLERRAACLQRAAELIQQRMPLFVRLLVEEAGKSIVDALAEVREAVDFFRYYAMQALNEFNEPVSLPGPNW